MYGLFTFEHDMSGYNNKCDSITDMNPDYTIKVVSIRKI